MKTEQQKIAENNLILKFRVGSYLYGTSTPESDEDFCGIFMPEKDYVLGFKKMEEIDLSIKDKDDLGKNTKDAVDIKLYEIRKFLKLAMENNPNIIEMLFVNEENIIYTDDEIVDVNGFLVLRSFGKYLLDHRHLFPHKGLIHKYKGYSYSQKHKMENKYRELEEIEKEIKRRCL